MANFLIALKITGGNEGGYSNNPDDSGGETFAGISRNNWPNWNGWELIDGYKVENGGIKNINSLLNAPQMISDIGNFYKSNFWDVNKLDLINDQQIANNIYDCGVNNGTGYAAKTLQRAINVTIDGIIGNITLTAINNGNPEFIYNSINAIRKARYIQLAVGSQAQFLKSWLSRLIPYQTA